MPAKRRATSKDGFNISFKALGGIVTLLTLVGFLWSAISKVATKDDVKELSTKYDATLMAMGGDYHGIEARVRNLEIQFATYFGKNSTTTFSTRPSSSNGTEGKLVLVAQEGSASSAASSAATQSMSPSIPRQFTYTRKVVVPVQFIKVHELLPSKGGSYAVLGEDGNFYALDDVLSALISEHLDENKEEPLPSRKYRRKD